MMSLQEATMGDGRDGEGKKLLAKREVRYWGATIVGVIVALLITEWIAYFAFDNPSYVEGSGALRRFFPPGIAITGAAVLTIFFTGFVVYTYRIIDEQEREAFHWANTVSWYGACIISMIWFFLHAAQLVAPVNGLIVLLISGALGLIIWAWKKYF